MPSRGRRTNVALTAFLWAGRRKQVSRGRTTVLGVKRRSTETETAPCLTSACPPGESPGESLNPDLSPHSELQGVNGNHISISLYPFLSLSSSFSLLSAQLRPALCPSFHFVFSVETFCNICPPNSAAQGCLRNHKSQSRWWLRKHQWLTELFRANPYYWCQLRAACHCSVTVQTQRLKFG